MEEDNRKQSTQYHQQRSKGHTLNRDKSLQMDTSYIQLLPLFTHARRCVLVKDKWSKLEVTVLQKEVHTRTWGGNNAYTSQWQQWIHARDMHCQSRLLDLCSNASSFATG